MRKYLWLLVLACTVPILLLTIAREVQAYGKAVERAQQQTLETARALRFALDRELDGRMKSVQALAFSRALEAGDLSAFRDQAERFLTIQPQGSSIILSDASGQQLLNTNLESGSPLPRRGSMDPVEHVFSAGQPYVSGLFIAAGTGRPTLGVEVPVFRNGKPVYDLTLSLPLRLFQDLIHSHMLPENWTVSVFDQYKVHIVRQPEPERFLGSGPGDALRALMEAGAEGAGEAVTLAGVPAFTVFSRSDLSNWSVVISVPRAILQRDLQWSLAGAVATWMLIASIGAFAASRVSQRITAPIERLAEMARAIGCGEAPPSVPPGPREVEHVGKALAASAAALRESQDRLRLAHQAGRVGQWDLDLASGSMWWSDSMYRLCGLEPRAGRLSLDEVRAMIHPDDRAVAAQAERAALEGQQPFDIEVRLLVGDGRTRWIVSRAEVVRDAEGRPVRLIGIDMDVTDRREAQERERLLIREVDHRAKNVLAVVQALVRLTPADDPVSFARAVESRISALARAHTLLANSRWTGVGLRELLEQEFAPYLVDPQDKARQVVLDGPSVIISPDAAQPISMMAHELATNAAKYGALSAADGHLRVSWALNGGSQQLEVTWQEQGGPAIEAAPVSQGFGTTLLRTSARQLGGEVAFDWMPGGLRCSWRLPANEVAWPAEKSGQSRQPAPAPPYRNDPRSA